MGRYRRSVSEPAGRGCVKGSVIASRLAFVRSELGADGLERVRARLPDSDAQMLTGIVVPIAWYPFDLCERLDRAIVDVLDGDEQVFRKLGERSAVDNLGSLHRVYLHERDPQALLERAASIYRLYYDTGHREYERISDRKAVLRTIGSRTFSRADCLTVVGWHCKAIELCGGKNPVVTETRCRARGDEVCEYVCEWE